MPMPSNDLSSRLHALADPAYRLFQCKLTPTVPPEQVWGVRTPQLRALAKEAAGTPEAAAFLAALPHAAYDENNLHGALLCLMRDYDACLAAVEAFLPYIDNWATCDMLSPRVFARHTDALLAPIRRWMASPHVYTCRFGMGMLMRYYLEPAAFHPEYLQWVAAIRSDEYYINMMIAWFFATALAKQYDAALPYLERHALAPWTHNKAIQKALESDRVSDVHKAYLRNLKVKPPQKNQHQP